LNRNATLFVDRHVARRYLTTRSPLLDCLVEHFVVAVLFLLLYFGVQNKVPCFFLRFPQSSWTRHSLSQHYFVIIVDETGFFVLVILLLQFESVGLSHGRRRQRRPVRLHKQTNLGRINRLWFWGSLRQRLALSEVSLPRFCALILSFILIDGLVLEAFSEGQVGPFLLGHRHDPFAILISHFITIIILHIRVNSLLFQQTSSLSMFIIAEVVVEFAHSGEGEFSE